MVGLAPVLSGDPRDRGGPLQPLLLARHLRKHFKIHGGLLGGSKNRVHAVDDISFQIAKGETLGVVGESGCGKSTTARVLMRLIEPDDGAVIFDGEALGARRWRRVVPARAAPLHADVIPGQLRFAQPAPADRGNDRVQPASPWAGPASGANAGTFVARPGRPRPRSLRAPLPARSQHRAASTRQHRPRAGART